MKLCKKALALLLVLVMTAAAVFLPKPWALLAFVPYLLPAYAGISNYLLTEVPFYLFFAIEHFVLCDSLCGCSHTFNHISSCI